MAVQVDRISRQKAQQQAGCFDDDDDRWMEDKRARFGPNPHGINAAMLSNALRYILNTQTLTVASNGQLLCFDLLSRDVPGSTRR